MRFAKLIGIGLAPTCLLAAVSACPLPAQAQAPEVPIPEPAPQDSPPAPEKARDGELRSVPLRNIPAAVVAFLLEPRHQPEPLMFSTSRRNSSNLSGDAAKSLAEASPPSVLAPGVSIEKVDQAGNALLLRGEAGALDTSEKAIRALDKPLQQIEIEVQMVQFVPDALKYLSVPTDVPGPHLLAADVPTKLRELLGSKRAKVITAPRVLAISGLTASLSSTTSSPARIVPATDIKGGEVPASPQFMPPVRLWVQRSIGMTVRPTVRPDNSIDMELAAGISWQIQGELGSAPLRRARQVSFSAQSAVMRVSVLNKNTVLSGFHCTATRRACTPKRRSTTRRLLRRSVLARPYRHKVTLCQSSACAIHT